MRFSGSLWADGSQVHHFELVWLLVAKWLPDSPEGSFFVVFALVAKCPPHGFETIGMPELEPKNVHSMFISSSN